MEGDDRYNRQVYAVGEDAQAVLGATRLLLVGCGALGEEAAKNAVLMGVGRVLLRAGPHDSAARAAELAARLRELNPLVRVEESGPAEEAVRAGACNAVLVAGDEAMPMTEQAALDGACRLARALFLSCSLRPGSGCVFADFGEAHEVRDPDGEPPVSGALLGAPEGGAWEAEEERHGLYAGDEVAAGERGERRTVERVLSQRFVALSGPPSRPGERLSFRQTKAVRTVAQGPLGAHHKSEELRQHLALPVGPYDAALGSVIAAVAAHELLKRGGKFSPLDQWFWHREALPLPPPLRAGLRLLIVGAGAIGCELLKALALSGAAVEVTLVDPDCIEQTNLSRQLLFRGGDIGRGKAEVASREAMRLSAALRVRPVATLLNAASEAALPGLFEVDCVLGAVDNIEARLYIDDRCRWHGVPLVDCGTQGAKGSVQAVVPGLTETYGASADPETPAVPQCTVHMFPTKPLHTVMAAADAFHGLFGPESPAPGPEETPERWARTQFEERFGAGIARLLERHPPDSVVAESGLLFWSPPRRMPHPLTFAEAEHGSWIALTAALRAESLVNPLRFDKDGPASQLAWVVATANLRAACYGIEPVTPLEARRIAGRIVPALVTATAAVAGLALLQLARIAAALPGRPPISSLRNWFVNLALAVAYESEPLPPRLRKLRAGWTVSEHDFIVVRGPCSWGELIGRLESEHLVQVQGLSLGAAPLWSLYSPPKDEELFLAADVRAWLAQRHPSLAAARSAAISLTADLDPDGDAEDVDSDAELPDVKFIF